MAYTGQSFTLINYDSAGSPATNQSPTAKTFTSTDNSPEDQQFDLVYSLSQSGGATSPTSSLYIEVSSDNSTWFQAALIGLSSTSGTAGRQSINGWKYMRARLVVGGATAPAVVCAVAVGFSGQGSAA